MTTKSEKTTFTTSKLSFPNLGEQTLAVRMSGVTRGITVTMDVITVGIGHNLISFVAGGMQPMNPTELEKVVRDGIAKVATVPQWG